MFNSHRFTSQARAAVWSVLEVKQDCVDVGLSPIAAVKAAQHSPGGILFRPVCRVALLSFKQFAGAALTDLLGLIHQVQVERQILLERRHDRRFDEGIALLA